MSDSIPTSEPATIIAGMTAKWRRPSSARYPATAGWVLHYALRERTGAHPTIEFTATEAAGTWLVSLDAAATAAYAPADYDWFAWVEKDGEKHPLDQGSLRITPDPTGPEGDTRSLARRILAELEEAALKLAGKTISSAAINGRTYTQLDRESLRADIVYWRKRVAQEDARARRARGLPDTSTIRVRFTPTTYFR